VEEDEPVKGIVDDLLAEQNALDAIVGHMDGPSWCEQTPAAGWDVSDQIGHLTFFDERATMAITDRQAFESELADAAPDLDTYMQEHLVASRRSSASELLTSWRDARSALIAALGTVGPSDRVPWYGPDMSARSFASARLMEVWAHGQDVADALGVIREPTDRLRHIALLGVKTMGWSFSINGEPVPDLPVRVELTGPAGVSWAWGDKNAADTVRGDGEEFCLVVTQRCNIADTSIETTGAVATRWMQIAQAFAGPPGPGRPATS
jgi:uncharacterized protein (TIGR03084 family)